MKLLKKINGKHTGLFAAGLLLGTASTTLMKQNILVCSLVQQE